MRGYLCVEECNTSIEINTNNDIRDVDPYYSVLLAFVHFVNFTKYLPNMKMIKLIKVAYKALFFKSFLNPDSL